MLLSIPNQALVICCLQPDMPYDIAVPLCTANECQRKIDLYLYTQYTYVAVVHTNERLFHFMKILKAVLFHLTVVFIAHISEPGYNQISLLSEAEVQKKRLCTL